MLLCFYFAQKKNKETINCDRRNKCYFPCALFCLSVKTPSHGHNFNLDIISENSLLCLYCRLSLAKEQQSLALASVCVEIMFQFVGTISFSLLQMIIDRSSYFFIRSIRTLLKILPAADFGILSINSTPPSSCL